MELSLPHEMLDAERVALPLAHPAYQSLAKAGDLKQDRAARLSFYALEVPADQVVCRVTQVHSRRVVDASQEGRRGETPRGGIAQREKAGGGRAARDERFLDEADGMVTAAGGPWLAVTVADCLPLFVFDEQTGAYGLLHSGWKGTGILEDALGLMQQRFGTEPEHVHVLAGAGIHACCYEVSPERGEDFAAWGGDAVVTAGVGRSCGRPHLDLYAANRHLARRLGIATFTQVTSCTCCDDRFGSYRREGADAYTSMIALIGPRHQ